MVGTRCAYVWNGSRISAIFRRPAHSNLWENCLRTGKLSKVEQSWAKSSKVWRYRYILICNFKISGTVSIPLQLGFERSIAQFIASRFDQTLWQLEKWCQRHQGSQVVFYNRLDSNLSEKGKIITVILIAVIASI